MVIAEISIAHPALPLSPTVQATPEITIHREFQPASAEEDVWLFFSAETNGFTEFDDTLEADPTITAPRLIADFSDQRIYRVQLTDTAKVVAPTLAKLGIQILDIQSTTDGWFLRLQLPDRDALVEFRKYCEQENISFSVNSLYLKEEADSRGGFGLTDAQQEALIMALEKGYYNDPRDITLGDLAEEMGISSAALGRRLRRATAKLITTTLYAETDQQSNS